MTDNTPTTYANKLAILADLWLNYKHDEEFQDFVEYNDIGLPLAYAISNDIVSTSLMAEQFIDETFELLLAALEAEDTGFENLDDLLASAQ